MTDASGDRPAKEPAFPLLKEEIEGFAGRSAVLGAILRGGEATRIVAAYEREDQRAIEEQGRFPRVATHLSRLGAGDRGRRSLILTLGVLQPWLQKHVDPRFAQVIPWAVAALGFVGLLIGGYAAARLYELNAGDLARDWMQSRARAEQLRRDYFDRLVAHAAAADPATLDAATRPRLQSPAPTSTRRTSRSVASATRRAPGIGCDGQPLPPASPRSASPRVGMVGAVGGPWLLAIAALGAIGAPSRRSPPHRRRSVRSGNGPSAFATMWMRSSCWPARSRTCAGLSAEGARTLW